jgi:hypothetical protein
VVVEPHLGELRAALARAGLVAPVPDELLDVCQDNSAAAAFTCAAGAD